LEILKESPMRQLKANTRRQRRAAVRAAAKGEAFPLVRSNAAGIDVGSRVHYVAVPPELNQPVRSFDCMTQDLKELGEWLRGCGVETVALEATGVYWIPLVEMLEDCGFEVYLVDARQTRNLSGYK
jgi:transposase